MIMLICGMKHFLLLYDFVDNYIERRTEFRTQHLNLAWAAAAKGELVLAGALTDPADGAVLLFRAEAADVAEAFAKADPYVTNGLATNWRVREWTTVVGEDATMPVRA